MVACCGQILASNYVATNSRTLISDSQAMDIPATQYELKVHNQKCKIELKKLNRSLLEILLL